MMVSGLVLSLNICDILSTYGPALKSIWFVSIPYLSIASNKNHTPHSEHLYNRYPTINIDDGLEAMYLFLTSRTSFSRSRVSFLIKLTKWVLTNNYVMFGEATYLHISGTAMDIPCAVVFACIYMHIIEQEALDIFAYQRYAIRSIFLFIRLSTIYSLSPRTMTLIFPSWNY
jgi:hypothetical protein